MRAIALGDALVALLARAGVGCVATNRGADGALVVTASETLTATI